MHNLKPVILVLWIDLCCAVLSRSVLSNSLQPPWTEACQAPLSMGILQARILEWIAMPFSRGSCQSRDWTQVSAFQADSLPSEPPGSWWILEWLAYPFSRGSFQSRNQTGVSCIADRVITSWATREAPWIDTRKAFTWPPGGKNSRNLHNIVYSRTIWK